MELLEIEPLVHLIVCKQWLIFDRIVNDTYQYLELSTVCKKMNNIE